MSPATSHTPYTFHPTPSFQYLVPFTVSLALPQAILLQLTMGENAVSMNISCSILALMFRCVCPFKLVTEIIESIRLAVNSQLQFGEYFKVC